MAKILVVDDEPTYRDALTFNLRRDGFQVVAAADGNAAMALFESENPDLILLDLMLPGLSGIEVCNRVRASSNVPIIMVTAKDDEVDKIVGLEVGADDYLTKPYSYRELVARIRAVLRRVSSNDAVEEQHDVLSVGAVTLDSDAHVVTVNGKPVAMPLREFELLEMFMENPGRVLTRSQILDRIWGMDYVGDTKTLDVHVKRIRAKIEDDPSNPAMLVTIRGLGYKLVG
ncbi:MAG: response regulator transcription factor [Ancrocorticia sp.]|jgi:two-component system response regulator RegX3|nr:response regulator transcription factor [Ancrocorticia sp.]MCI1896023.1 response regulator transcription factor [Ancrocorticia sp.]MCI1932727.1 response regulator transcription factor [Ancrocorticia sp.]MCI1963815.1 response regulator transcription factor [Ancrocorticia sp.]MCI2002153.1 response regulator transcription factor [Ancrocorticia sp.]